MLFLLKFSSLLALVAGWGMTETLKDSCLSLESIEPCDMGSLLDVGLGRCGVRVTPESARVEPTVAFDQAKDSKKYLLVMVDPDAPSAEKPKFRYWRHWVLSDISGSSLRSGHPKGTIQTEYNGPSPPRDSGPHRYQFLLFEQPGDLKSVTSLGNSNRGKWQLRDFIQSNRLCNHLVAGYEFISEEQT